MKKTAIAAAFLAVSIMLAACATEPTKEPSKQGSQETTIETTTETTAEETTTETSVANVPDTANLFGNPDMASKTEKGVMKSSDIEAPWVEDLFCYTSVIEWIDYSPIVAGSELTVEFFINDDTTTGEKINLYIFEKNDEYAWDTENAVAKFEGDACNTVNGNVYWCKTNLPEEIATGDYTLVVVRDDGTVDSMWDVQIVSSVEETATQYSID